MKKIKICIVTSSRAEYGLLKNLIKKFNYQIDLIVICLLRELTLGNHMDIQLMK